MRNRKLKVKWKIEESIAYAGMKTKQHYQCECTTWIFQITGSLADPRTDRGYTHHPTNLSPDSKPIRYSLLFWETQTSTPQTGPGRRVAYLGCLGDDIQTALLDAGSTSNGVVAGDDEQRKKSAAGGTKHFDPVKLQVTGTCHRSVQGRRRGIE